jgi:hypothetical protein
MLDNKTQEQRAERGRAIIAQVRELEAEDKARGEAFAATITSPNKRFNIRRDPAAALVAQAIGAPYSTERLRRTDCPFIAISKIALYAEDDLRRVAEDILKGAPLRHGTPDKRGHEKKSAGAAR